MNISEAIAVVENHNKWRRSGSGEMCDPTALGEALDLVLLAAKEHGSLFMVMVQIASKTRKTKEQRLANSCVKFLESIHV